jgi:glycosyltransferase involved in cell wall biosynthesis
VRFACVSQDPGVGPRRRKGAAVHLLAMRRAFAALGADVVGVDEPDDAALERALDAAHAAVPIDVVYERYALGRMAGARWATAHGARFVLEANSPLADEAARYRGAAPGADEEGADRAAFGAAALVLAVSAPVAEYAVRRGADTASVLVVPNAVDPERFRPRLPGDALRATIAPDERLVLGFHGRLRPWHGFELFAEAARRLLASGVDAHLLLVGEGDFDEHLAGVPSDRVTRVPWVPHDEVARWVACMDALPLTYLPDAPCYFSPLKLAEAMAAGVVPVAPQLGELAVRLADGAGGMLYAPGDVDGLTAALRTLADRPARRAELAAGAVALARRHTWVHVAETVWERLGLQPAAER